MSLDHLDETHARILRQMCDAVGMTPERATEEDAFVGFFQSFRPDGNGISGLFDGHPASDEMQERLTDLFEAAGEDRRPQGGKDAYFVVRQPAEISPELVRLAGQQWLSGLARLAEDLGMADAAQKLKAVETVRVLEGIPPKHPKLDHEKTNLLRLLKDEAPGWIEAAAPDHAISHSLRPAYYFINCDPMLRDYLMWPMMRDSIATDFEPFEPYFQLWRHGVKWRAYQEQQIDLYMPRR
ncbi:hypothetical protein SAMN06265222_10443 [Neorhodopirellula lusitana]|uniref:Apolipoprotein acyltransferase n=1 Tax=Neorhodopirellula lusitana TaxID=445327 RepID=A0ABY1Q0Y9_9BACT|nr:apolipoprotein acyltransferase [Neorhodopirellula lusitana]SMP53044.1 hypothetical protein SAMN06265222_10443 [Neorhodopirellula lusitana]